MFSVRNVVAILELPVTNLPWQLPFGYTIKIGTGWNLLRMHYIINVYPPYS